MATMRPPRSEAELVRYLARTFGIDQRTTGLNRAHVRRLARLLRGHRAADTARIEDQLSLNREQNFALQRFWQLESQLASLLQRQDLLKVVRQRQARLLCFLIDIRPPMAHMSSDSIDDFVNAARNRRSEIPYVVAVILYGLFVTYIVRTLMVRGRGKMEMLMRDMEIHVLDHAVTLPGLGNRAGDAIFILLFVIFVLLLLILRFRRVANSGGTVAKELLDEVNDSEDYDDVQDQEVEKSVPTTPKPEDLLMARMEDMLEMEIQKVKEKLQRKLNAQTRNENGHLREEQAKQRGPPHADHFPYPHDSDRQGTSDNEYRSKIKYLPDEDQQDKIEFLNESHLAWQSEMEHTEEEQRADQNDQEDETVQVPEKAEHEPCRDKETNEGKDRKKEEHEKAIEEVHMRQTEAQDKADISKLLEEEKQRQEVERQIEEQRRQELREEIERALQLEMEQKEAEIRKQAEEERRLEESQRAEEERRRQEEEAHKIAEQMRVEEEMHRRREDERKKQEEIIRREEEFILQEQARKMAEQKKQEEEERRCIEEAQQREEAIRKQVEDERIQQERQRVEEEQKVEEIKLAQELPQNMIEEQRLQENAQPLAEEAEQIEEEQKQQDEVKQLQINEEAEEEERPAKKNTIETEEEMLLVDLSIAKSSFPEPEWFVSENQHQQTGVDTDLFQNQHNTEVLKNERIAVDEKQNRMLGTVDEEGEIQVSGLRKYFSEEEIEQIVELIRREDERNSEGKAGDETENRKEAGKESYEEAETEYKEWSDDTLSEGKSDTESIGDLASEDEVSEDDLTHDHTVGTGDERGDSDQSYDDITSERIDMDDDLSSFISDGDLDDDGSLGSLDSSLIGDEIDSQPDDDEHDIESLDGVRSNLVGDETSHQTDDNDVLDWTDQDDVSKYWATPIHKNVMRLREYHQPTIVVSESDATSPYDEETRKRRERRAKRASRKLEQQMMKEKLREKLRADEKRKEEERMLRRQKMKEREKKRERQRLREKEKLTMTDRERRQKRRERKEKERREKERREKREAKAKEKTKDKGKEQIDAKTGEKVEKTEEELKKEHEERRRRRKLREREKRRKERERLQRAGLLTPQSLARLSSHPRRMRSSSTSTSRSVSPTGIRRHRPRSTSFSQKGQDDEPAPSSVHAVLTSMLEEQGGDIPLEKVPDKEGVYKLRDMIFKMNVVNGFLIIRVGGGYMMFPEWYRTYAKRDTTLVVNDVIPSSMGVHVRKSRHVSLLNKDNLP